ncbi:MAG TPA: potassium-transporting ATPase subunit C, partial [Opitutaceae bacterium]
MKTLVAELKTSVVATLILVGVLCGLYPFAVWVLGGALFPEKVNGSLVTDASGTVRGSALLGQGFTGEQYFHPRPSSAGSGYDAANSSGSNLGPTSQKLADTLKADIAAYRMRNGLASTVA